jgi:hypothetical protein
VRVRVGLLTCVRGRHELLSLALSLALALALALTLTLTLTS